MTVADLIESRHEVFSMSDQTTAYEAVRFLREKEVRAAGVLDAQGRLVGVISQSDISDKLAAQNKCPAWMHVSGIMNTRPMVMNPTTPLDECLPPMEKYKMF